MCVLVGCGSSAAVDAPKPTGSKAQDAQLLDGRQVFISNCARCHGSHGQGGVGPALEHGHARKRFPNPNDQVKFVKSGFGIMPSFDGRLSQTQINDVVRYTREVL